MVQRREVISTVGVVGSTLIAGCGSSSDNQPNSEPSQEESEQASKDEQDAEDTPSEVDTQGIEGLILANTEFRYNFSAGITATVELENNTEKGEGPSEVNVLIEAYQGGEVVDSDNTWESTEGTFSSEGLTITFDLQLEDVSETADVTIDDLTEIKIFAKSRNIDYRLYEELSGETIRDRVGK